ncbi:hypothetical protein DSUL_60190 [Desulfovibrionales bacterium]
MSIPRHKKDERNAIKASDTLNSRHQLGNNHSKPFRSEIETSQTLGPDAFLSYT